MSRRGRRVHLALALWAAFVCAATLLPLGRLSVPGAARLFELAASVTWIDELVHVGLFAVLGWLAWRSATVVGWKRPALSAIIAAAVFGVALELLQWPIPTRQPSLTDQIANTAGALLGAIMGAVTAPAPHLPEEKR